METNLGVHLGIVLDPTVLVACVPWPWCCCGDVSRGDFVPAAFAFIAGVLHHVSYLIALLFQDAAEVPGAVAFHPVEPVIVLLYAAAVAALLAGGPGRRPTTDGG